MNGCAADQKIQPLEPTSVLQLPSTKYVDTEVCKGPFVEYGHLIPGRSTSMLMWRSVEMLLVSATLESGCFHNLGVLLVGVLITRALLLRIYVKAPGFWLLPYTVTVADGSTPVKLRQMQSALDMGVGLNYCS